MGFKFSAHRPVVMGAEWMITADHPLAAQAGAAILERGGNAVDAAVAANLVMAVVRPHMCGLGGDLFALIYMAGEERVSCLNASGRAPAAADLERYHELGHWVMPESGILSATVPGAIAGWQAALDRYGTMGLDALLTRPIEYARRGFPVYRELAEVFLARREALERSPAARETYFPNGEAPQMGRRLVQPDLAESMARLAEEGPSVFYGGALGAALVDFSRNTGGLFAIEDLASYRATWGSPIGATYRDLEILTHPPNSQGVALPMQANILENFDIKAIGFGQAELVHLMVEAKKLAFADRDRYVCDPDFHAVPVNDLLSKDYALERSKLIDPGRAAAGYPAGAFTLGGEDTVYLTVADGQGNTAVFIQSLYEAFGSCVMPPGTGMLLHNRGRGFSLDPDHVNRLEPGKRPYHTLHPAMVLHDGRPWLLFGTPGADGQTQTNIQLLTSIVEFGADPQQAMEAPRWRSNPDGTLLIESRFPGGALKDLEKMGHNLAVEEPFAPIMGSAQALIIDRENGVLLAGVDPRREAYAIGR